MRGKKFTPIVALVATTNPLIPKKPLAPGGRHADLPLDSLILPRTLPHGLPSQGQHQFELGKNLFFGRGRRQEPAAGLLEITKAADLGHVEAMAWTAMILLEGPVPQDPRRALRYAQRAADAGNALAEDLMGDFYRGLYPASGVSMDPQISARWYNRAADKLDLFGLRDLAWCYQNGFGLAKDEIRAADLYRRAGEEARRRSTLGDPLATSLMAGIHMVVHKDERQAAAWYRKAAELGHVHALYWLGWLSHEGRGLTKDLPQAAAWYRKAAELGDILAQSSLGTIYATGDGVPKDDAQAFHWFEKAASCGFAPAQAWLGEFYKHGRAVAQNDVLAVNWYRKAAAQGNADGQFGLGGMYETGRGVARDMSLAMSWYTQAHQQGHPEATQCLARLSPFMTQERVFKPAPEMPVIEDVSDEDKTDPMIPMPSVAVVADEPGEATAIYQGALSDDAITGDPEPPRESPRAWTRIAKENLQPILHELLR